MKVILALRGSLSFTQSFLLLTDLHQDALLNLHHDNDVKEIPWSLDKNRPIRKSEFVQCMKVGK